MYVTKHGPLEKGNGKPLQYSCLVIHTVEGLGAVNEAKVDAFLELSCFFDDPTDTGNLISGSFLFLFYTQFVFHNKLWKILKEMGIPNHLTCLLRNQYAGQEAIVRTGHGTTDWFQIGKGVHQGCILTPCLFNLYAEYIMRHAGMDEAQAGIQIAGRNINNLRYADDTTVMAEREEKLKSLLMKVKEQSEKAGLKQHSEN